ncbi:MAG: T9SS type A sorting domain-containing protein [Flavobacterium sp.]|nr:T9SS type A sorting domain-containing protein [Flavobacterium sp.]
MKQLLFFLLLIFGIPTKAQSIIQSVNSGSLITSSSSVSIGEIVVVPQNQSQSSSGIIGILAQTQQTLEVPQLELSQNITVFPNPTTATVYFQSDTNIVNEKVIIVNVSGQIVAQKTISAANSLDLSMLSSGIYLLQFNNKKINSFKIIKH